MVYFLAETLKRVVFLRTVRTYYKGAGVVLTDRGIAIKKY